MTRTVWILKRFYLNSSNRVGVIELRIIESGLVNNERAGIQHMVAGYNRIIRSYQDNIT